MPYVKNIWQNKIPGVQAGTKVSAGIMNSMEKGIELTNSQSEVKTAGGTATAITLSGFGLDDYFTGLKVTFIASANNNGAATTINIDGKGAKSIFKPATVLAPNFKAGRAYTIYYSGTSFFWQASAEGDAVVANVLAGKTFSNDDDTGLIGTIPSKTAQTFTPGTTNQTIASGQFLSGVQTISGSANLVAGNIKNGVNIFGVVGNYPTINVGEERLYRVNGVTWTFALNDKQKMVDVKVHFSGTYRIKFMLAGSVVQLRGQIYRNGSPYGTERVNTSGNGNHVTYTQDLSFNENDNIQLYTWHQNNSYGTTSTSTTDFEICTQSGFVVTKIM
jgi:hypothetical protein